MGIFRVIADYVDYDKVYCNLHYSSRPSWRIRSLSSVVVKECLGQVLERLKMIEGIINDLGGEDIFASSSSSSFYLQDILGES